MIKKSGIVMGYILKVSMLATVGYLGVLYCQWGTEFNTQLMSQMIENYSR
ncbi:MAG: hypothetical protein ACE3L7_32730 [Candidatus Pristimantibacillus sp.]